MSKEREFLIELKDYINSGTSRNDVKTLINKRLKQTPTPEEVVSAKEEMTREELKKEVGLVLEQFDGNPDADMHTFTEGIIDIANAYIKIELIKSRKKVIVDYLERALANER